MNLLITDIGTITRNPQQGKVRSLIMNIIKLTKQKTIMTSFNNVRKDKNGFYVLKTDQ